jgi:hypothetical protein
MYKELNKSETNIHQQDQKYNFPSTRIIVVPSILSMYLAAANLFTPIFARIYASSVNGGGSSPSGAYRLEATLPQLSRRELCIGCENETFLMLRGGT